MALFVPYILSLFSNPPVGKPGHLTYLEEEKENLKKLFNAARAQPDIHLDYSALEDKEEDALTSLKISDYMEEFGQKLTIVHYSGHADRVLLSMNEADVRAQNFARYIRDCRNIRIVVLNGCSTSGFVQYLLQNTTVKAVIATNNPVKDKRAMVFSTRFYERLLKKEPVAEAFSGALAAALDKEYQADSFIYKVNMDRGQIESVDLLSDEKGQAGVRNVSKAGVPVLADQDKIASWGIYTRMNDLLDWNIFESATDSEKRVQDIDRLIKEKNARLFELEDEINDLEDLIPALRSKKASGAENGHRLQEKIDKLSGKQQEQAKCKNEIGQLENEKRAYSEERNEEDLINSFSQSVLNLNYRDQYARISELKKKALLHKFSCFMLHGNSSSCLHLLSRRMRTWLGFQNERKVIFDFRSNHINDFWEKLQIDIAGKILSRDPDQAAQKLVSYYRGADGRTKNHFLLLFLNAPKDQRSPTLFNQTVISFWKDLIARFGKYDTELSHQHGIYAFVMDDACEAVQQQDCYVGSKEDEYLSLVGEDNTMRATFQLLPVVSPLDADLVWDWQLESVISDPYRYEYKVLQEIITDTQGYFLDTVQELGCRKIDNEAARQRIRNILKKSIDKPI